MTVEALAVIGNGQEERIVWFFNFDPCVFRAGVLRDVRERLLDYPVDCGFCLRVKSLEFIRTRECEENFCPFLKTIHINAESRNEAEIIENRWAEIESNLPNRIQRLVDNLLHYHYPFDRFVVGDRSLSDK